MAQEKLVTMDVTHDLLPRQTRHQATLGKFLLAGEILLQPKS